MSNKNADKPKTPIPAHKRQIRLTTSDGRTIEGTVIAPDRYVVAVDTAAGVEVFMLDSISIDPQCEAIGTKIVAVERPLYNRLKALSNEEADAIPEIIDSLLQEAAVPDLIGSLRLLISHIPFRPYAGRVLDRLIDASTKTTDYSRDAYLKCIADALKQEGRLQEALEAVVELNGMSPTDYSRSLEKAIIKELSAHTEQSNQFLMRLKTLTVQGSDTDKSIADLFATCLPSASLAEIDKALMYLTTQAELRRYILPVFEAAIAAAAQTSEPYDRTAHLKAIAEGSRYVDKAEIGLEALVELNASQPTDYTLSLEKVLRKQLESVSDEAGVDRPVYSFMISKKKYYLKPNYSRFGICLKRACEIADAAGALPYDIADHVRNMWATLPSKCISGALYSSFADMFGRLGLNDLLDDLQQTKSNRLDNALRNNLADCQGDEANAAFQAIISSESTSVLTDELTDALRRGLGDIVSRYLAADPEWNESSIFAISKYLNKHGLFSLNIELTQPLVDEPTLPEMLKYYIRYQRALAYLSITPGEMTAEHLYSLAGKEAAKAPKLAGSYTSLTKEVHSRLHMMRDSISMDIKPEKDSDAQIKLLNFFDDYMRGDMSMTDFFRTVGRLELTSKNIADFLSKRQRLTKLLARGGYDCALEVCNFFLNRANASAIAGAMCKTVLENIGDESVVALVHYIACRTADERSVVLYHINEGLKTADDELALVLETLGARVKERKGRFYTRSRQFRRRLAAAIAALSKASNFMLKSWTVNYLRQYDFVGFGSTEGDMSHATIQEWLERNRSNTKPRVLLTALLLRIYDEGEAIGEEKAKEYIGELNSIFKTLITFPGTTTGLAVNLEFNMLRQRNPALVMGMGVKLICGKGIYDKAEPVELLGAASEEVRRRAAAWLLRCAASSPGLQKYADLALLSRECLPVSGIYEAAQWEKWAGQFKHLYAFMGRNGVLADVKTSADFAEPLTDLRARYAAADVLGGDRSRFVNTITALLAALPDNTQGRRRTSREALEAIVDESLRRLVNTPAEAGFDPLLKMLRLMEHILDSEINAISVTAPVLTVDALEYSTDRLLTVEVSLAAAETWDATDITISAGGEETVVADRMRPGESRTATIRVVGAPADRFDGDISLEYVVEENGNERSGRRIHISVDSTERKPIPNMYRRIFTSLDDHPDMFYGRAGLIERILDDLDSGNTRLIYGQSRSGKTSVLKKVMSLAKDRYAVVYEELTSLQAYCTVRLFFMHLYNDFVGAVGSRYGLVKVLDEHLFATEVKDDAGVPAYFRSLITDFYAAHPDAPRAALFIDEFSVVLGDIAADIQNGSPLGLATILQRWVSTFSNLNIRVIICGQNDTPTFFDVFSDRVGNFLAAVRTERLTFLTDSEARALITEPVKDAVIFSGDAVDTVIALSGRSPYYIVGLMMEIVDTLNSRGTAVSDSAFVREVAFKMLFEDKSVYFGNMYACSRLTGFADIEETLSTVLERIGSRLLLADGNVFSRADVVTPGSDAEAEAYRQLVERSVITESGATAAVTVGLFAEHLKRNAMHNLNSSSRRGRRSRKIQ